MRSPHDLNEASHPPASAGVWIVVPAYNEGTRLTGTLKQLLAHYGNVVVVDDGSRDDTSAAALAQEVWLLRHSINRGQGAALQTGIDFAVRQGAAIVVTFDGDGQHSAEDIENLLHPIRRGEADVVLGSRFLGEAQGIPFTRWLLLKLAVVFTRAFSRIRVTDTHNGLRAFSREAALQIRITQDRMAHASEILDRIGQLGLRYREMPVTIRYTTSTLEKGQSSWNAVRIVAQLFLGRVVP